MEVILREDVKDLGSAGQLVKVKPGYARNFLLPRGLAYEATEGNRRRIEAESKARAARLAEERDASRVLAARLAAVPVSLSRKAGEGGRLFGSITAQDIADALAAAGVVVDKRKIELEHPIKTTGQHSVQVNLHHDVKGEVRLTVVAE
ncbi:MAG: 50S ribosomal protein L9 [Gemmatimonadota bacterium]|nr:50S ribosomal protein L9 [Gemmatimonadota bacterium]MDH4348410.1 50S ribosomal protein L9 [Gemmatimonadota bacterium]